MTQFKKTYSLEKRQSESKRIIEKYSDRIPVICEKAPKCSAPDIDKTKFLIPRNLTIGQFLFVIRKRINLKAEEALFIFVVQSGHILPPTSATLEEVYNQYQDEDGFLYFVYATENTFGI